MSAPSATSEPHAAASPIDAAEAMLLLVDCQPGLSLAAASRPHQLLEDNVTTLVRTATTFSVPIVATTSARDRFSGPVWPRLAKLLPATPIERHALNVYDDPQVRDAIAATGRGVVLIAGILTEACVSFPRLSLRATGRVFIVADCCAGITPETHQLALSRAGAAGIGVTSWIQLLLEWQRDSTHAETYADAVAVLADFGGAYGLALQPARDMLFEPGRGTGRTRGGSTEMTETPADLILDSGKIVTLNKAQPSATALAIRDGMITAIGDRASIEPLRGPNTNEIDLGGRTVIPGLNDSHLHLIRGGLNYLMELRWDGVPSLADALRMLREQAARTPPPQWVRVIGGWSEFQFAERRMPTLDEINTVAADTPVFVLHLYTKALLNRAAVRALGYTRETPDPPRGTIQRDRDGEPTGLLIAMPDASILYTAIAGAPKLGVEQQVVSTLHFFRELNRLGITSAIDAGGGFQAYPDDYAVVQHLADSKELTVRIAMNLFTQKPGQELSDFHAWAEMTAPGAGDEFLKVNGVGEMIRYKCYDFENFEQPRPDPLAGGEDELEEALRFLVERRWPFRMHATYDESAGAYLNVIERVDRDVGLQGLRWFFDHCETVTEASIERIAALGGGIAIQDRMAFAGERFVERYGAAAAGRTPPIPEMLAAGLPVGAGTDATRVSSYNPWVSLAWLVTGTTVGGTQLQPRERCLDRMEALRRYTHGSAWFSGGEKQKGTLAVGALADLAVLSTDYLAVPEHEISTIVSVLTIVGGRIVHGAAEFSELAPPLPPLVPDWTPVGVYGVAYQPPPATAAHCHGHAPAAAGQPRRTSTLTDPFAGACWAF